MESTRCYSSLGFVLFFFFLTGSWKARDCPTTWCAAGPIGAESEAGTKHKCNISLFSLYCNIVIQSYMDFTNTEVMSPPLSNMKI